MSRATDHPTTLTRRAILAGAPAVAAAAALPALAANPDAELLDLAARHGALTESHGTALERADLLKFEIRDTVLIPKKIAWPAYIEGVPRTVPMDESALKHRSGNKCKRLRSALRALEVWQGEFDRRLEDAGWPALQAEADRLEAERVALQHQLLDTRAATPQGMLTKLDGVSEAFEDDAVASVYADLRALAGRVS